MINLNDLSTIVTNNTGPIVASATTLAGKLLTFDTESLAEAAGRRWHGDRVVPTQSADAQWHLLDLDTERLIEG